MGKKIVAILLIATMAMGIAACGGSGDKKDDNTITVWCWDKTFNIFAMEEAAKIYQEDHQDVKIDIVEVGDVWGVAGAERRTTAPRIVAPAAATKHTEYPLVRTFRIGLRTTAVISFPVCAPLPYISTHIVDA